MSLDDLLDAWRVNGQVNRCLLDLCPPESLDLKPGKGKTVRSAWTHIVGVRRMHLEDSHAAAAHEVPKLDWKTASLAEIAEGLERSDVGIVQLLRKLSERPNRWTAAKFFGYLVAHEAHHRSQIEIALRLGGVEPPEEALYGLWNWPKL